MFTFDYLNHFTGRSIRVHLDSFTTKAHYLEALRRYSRNVDWMDFYEFAFLSSGGRAASRSQSAAQALKDMWLQLGFQQGKVLRP